MPIAFYMDEHVDYAVTTGLRARGVDVLTVQEDGLSGADDPTLLDRATALGRVMVTQDQDFLVDAAGRQAAGVPFRGVIFSPQQGPSAGQMIADLEYIGLVGEPEDLADLVVHCSSLFCGAAFQGRPTSAQPWKAGPQIRCNRPLVVYLPYGGP